MLDIQLAASVLRLVLSIRTVAPSADRQRVGLTWWRQCLGAVILRSLRLDQVHQPTDETLQVSFRLRTSSPRLRPRTAGAAWGTHTVQNNITSLGSCLSFN